MKKSLVLDLLIGYVAGGCVLFFGELFASTNVQLYLWAEITWLFVVTYLAVKSEEKWLFILLSLPIFWIVEQQLILVIAMSLPYVLDRKHSL